MNPTLGCFWAHASCVEEEADTGLGDAGFQLGLRSPFEGTPPGVGRVDFCRVYTGPRKILSPALEVVGDSFNPRKGSLDAPTHLLEKVPGGTRNKSNVTRQVPVWTNWSSTEKPRSLGLPFSVPLWLTLCLTSYHPKAAAPNISSPQLPGPV